MNVLMVGGDTKGAWQMRGVQLGAALGARVTAAPRPADWRWADVVVLVKRAAVHWQAEARQLRVPVLWDALDYWAQPQENAQPREAAIRQLRAIQQAARVDVVIAATQAMADDVGGVYVSHHSRLGVRPAPVRLTVEAVGYDGTPKYLGRWRVALEQACATLGLRFVINPADPRDVDALVSFRDGPWDGWICRSWKSGVKHVNAIVAGRPILTQPTAAHTELAPVGALVDTIEALTQGVRLVTCRETRDAAYQQGLARANAFSVEAIAERYRPILAGAQRRAA